MAKFLFEVQQKNRLEQKGLLKRFSITCYGHQETIEEMRAAKAAKYKELKKTNNKKEIEEWFLNYKPDSGLDAIDKTNNKKKYNTKKQKSNTKTKHKKSLSLLSRLYGKKTRKNKSKLY
jgi:hypothetical protein